VYELSQKGGARRVGVAITEPYHLSFPYLFLYGKEIYMCPESSENRDIRVYRCLEFPLKWTLAKVLMSGVNAVDTLIFERNGKWWMLTTLDSADTGDCYSQLYLFHADSPVSDRWTSHPKNPIIIDPDCGRNAGLLRDGERVFRVAQGQGFRQYGASTRIFEISTISETDYVEEHRTSIAPSFALGLKGTHHLSCDGTTTVYDSVRYSWAFA